jgi:RHS repeat-associated protein
VNSLNQLTGGGRDGTWTVAGGTMGSVTNVTVNTSNSFLYADGTFASTNHTSANTFKVFTAVAKDDKGRSATNSSTTFSPPSPVFAYDLNGNLLVERSAGGVTNRLFEYDDENQLIRVMVTNAWKSEFTYDGKMRRRIRKEYTWTGSWVLTNEVRYLYDGNLVIQERDANNLPQVTYTRGKDLSGSMEGAGGIGGLLARTENPSSILNPPSSSAHAYYHADGNGNVTCLINSNQFVVARYNYDPFGSLIGLSGSLAEANLYRFSSKEFHANSGLVYYLYRYYESSLQRWVNRDPLGDFGNPSSLTDSDQNLSIRMGIAVELWQGANLYGYVQNAPLYKLDKDGRLVPIVVGGAAVGGAAAAVAATFGLSVVGCMLSPPCAEALKRAIGQAVEGVKEMCRVRPQSPSNGCRKISETAGMCIYSCSSPAGPYMGAIPKPRGGCPKNPSQEEVNPMPGRDYPGFPPK